MSAVQPSSRSLGRLPSNSGFLEKLSGGGLVEGAKWQRRYVLKCFFLWSHWQPFAQCLRSHLCSGSEERASAVSEADRSQEARLILGAMSPCSRLTQRVAFGRSRWFALNDGVLAWAKKATKIGKYPDASFSLCDRMPAPRPSRCVSTLLAWCCRVWSLH
jgi:hypothetical protein